jgi:hypothetical protein
MKMNGVSWNRERNTNFHNLAIVDDALRNLVLRLLRYSPAQRPVIGDIVKDEFITNVSKWNTDNAAEPKHYNIPHIPKVTTLSSENTPKLADQSDIPACHSLARALHSADGKNHKHQIQDVRLVFQEWFNQEFDSMYYIDVIRVYGNRMSEERILLSIIKMLRTMIDRKDHILEISIEEEFNKYLNENMNRYPFQVVFVDTNSNSSRYWATLAQQVESFLLLEVQSNLIMFYVC